MLYHHTDTFHHKMTAVRLLPRDTALVGAWAWAWASALASRAWASAWGHLLVDRGLHLPQQHLQLTMTRQPTSAEDTRWDPLEQRIAGRQRRLDSKKSDKKGATRISYFRLFPSVSSLKSGNMVTFESVVEILTCDH